VFILITAFPQVAINVYFAAAQKDVDAFDLAVGTVSVLMLAFQLVASVYAVCGGAGCDVAPRSLPCTVQRLCRGWGRASRSPCVYAN